jgi:hypothetical protein
MTPSSSVFSSQTWSVIWLDNYETIPRHHSTNRILDFETFQEVLETKQPNYINLVDQIEEGISYQVYYWPLFSRQTMVHLNLSIISNDIRNHLESFEGEEDRHVIGILQCQIKKNSDDPQIFSPQSLSQTSLLTYFNHVMSQVYSHIYHDGSDIPSLPSDHQNPIVKEDSIILQNSTFDSNHDEAFLSDQFFSTITSLFTLSSTLLTEKSRVQDQISVAQIVHEYLSKTSQAIWEHSCHQQLSAVGLFLRVENDSTPNPCFLGSIRTSELRTIHLRDDEENQSISIQFNPNRFDNMIFCLFSFLSRITECEVSPNDLINLIPEKGNSQQVSYGLSILDQFLEKSFLEDGENPHTMESLPNTYRTIYPIFHPLLDVSVDSDDSTTTFGYLIFEYLFIPPNEIELQFGFLMSKFLQMFSEKLFFWLIAFLFCV